LRCTKNASKLNLQLFLECQENGSGEYDRKCGKDGISDINENVIKGFGNTSNQGSKDKRAE